MNGLIIEVERAMISDTLNIYMAYESQGVITTFKSVELVMEPKPMKHGTMVAPTMSIPGMFAREFPMKMIDALTRKGYKSISDSKTEGLLEATKYHLQDMRNLVFKKRG